MSSHTSSSTLPRFAREHPYLGFALAVLAGAIVYRVVRRLAEPDHAPVTQAVVPVSPAATEIGRPGQNLEDRLDEAIQETFPGSDPIAVHIE